LDEVASSSSTLRLAAVENRLLSVSLKAGLVGVSGLACGGRTGDVGSSLF
jgi:hypothetical protein